VSMVKDMLSYFTLEIELINGQVSVLGYINSHMQWLVWYYNHLLDANYIGYAPGYGIHCLYMFYNIPVYVAEFIIL
jgi:hypothetical protein